MIFIWHTVSWLHMLGQSIHVAHRAFSWGVLVSFVGFLHIPRHRQIDVTAINEHGAIIPKSRGTHDQIFQTTHGKSVNDRIFSDKLVDSTYGYIL